MYEERREGIWREKGRGIKEKIARGRVKEGEEYRGIGVERDRGKEKEVESWGVREGDDGRDRCVGQGTEGDSVRRGGEIQGQYMPDYHTLILIVSQ